MTSDEDGIRAREGGDIRFEEVADMDVDAWGSKATGVLLDDGLALRTDLESADREMRKLQAGLDGYAACVGASTDGWASW